MTSMGVADGPARIRDAAMLYDLSASNGVLTQATHRASSQSTPVPGIPVTRLPPVGPGDWSWRSLLSHIFACLGFAATFTSVVLLIESWATKVPDPKEREKKAEAYLTAHIILVSLTAVFLISSLVLQKTGSAKVSRDSPFGRI